MVTHGSEVVAKRLAGHGRRIKSALGMTTSPARRAAGMRKRKHRAHAFPRFTTVCLIAPNGEHLGTIRVHVKPGGVWDLRPESTEHWTDEENAAWLAWDDAHHRAEFPKGLAIYPTAAPRSS